MEEHGNLVWLSVEEYRQLVEDRAVYHSVKYRVGGTDDE